MAKGSVTDEIMPLSKMKPLLSMSKQEPVSAAVGQTLDGEGVILLDKKAKPRAVLGLLKSGAAKAQIKLNTSSLRFGRAEVDTEYDPGMVRFFLNKDAPGALRAKLVEVVKQIAYQKVEMNVDPGLDAEPEDDDGSAVAAQVAGQSESPPPDAPPVQEPTAAAPALFDRTALTSEFSKLVPAVSKMAGAAPGVLDKLKHLAATAGAALKSGDLATASRQIEELREALAQSPAPAVPTSVSPHPATDAKHELAELIGRIGKLSSVEPAKKVSLLKLAGEANARIHANDEVGAAASVIALRQALDTDDGSAKAAVNARIKDITSQASTLPEALKAPVTELIAKATALAAGGDQATLRTIMDELETGLAKAAGAARVAEASAGTEGVVKQRILQKEWANAEAAARARLNAFVAAVLKDPRVMNDPLADDVRGVVKDIPGMIPDLGAAVEGAMGNLDKATDGQARRDATKAAADILDRYESELDDAEGLQELEQLANDEFGGLSFLAPLKAAISEMRTSLIRAA